MRPTQRGHVAGAGSAGDVRERAKSAQPGETCVSSRRSVAALDFVGVEGVSLGVPVLFTAVFTAVFTADDDGGVLFFSSRGSRPPKRCMIAHDVFSSKKNEDVVERRLKSASSY